MLVSCASPASASDAISSTAKTTRSEPILRPRSSNQASSPESMIGTRKPIVSDQVAGSLRHARSSRRSARSTALSRAISLTSFGANAPASESGIMAAKISGRVGTCIQDEVQYTHPVHELAVQLRVRGVASIIEPLDLDTSAMKGVCVEVRLGGGAADVCGRAQAGT